ncbi:unnamed protein product [Cuscuta campestris]|uniref:Late embryogenesis abundant protein LEA-2 subgroup domain-containing protein n=1 Tax=Cuscuta campestris TaxID=132261 RepID=A0A484MWR7_9ASTE|nr:unnamed protein product [Cuscuta campestris]
MPRGYETNPHFFYTADDEPPRVPRGPANIQPRPRQQPNGPEYWTPPTPHKSLVPQSPQPFLPQSHHPSSEPEDGSGYPPRDGTDRKLPLPPAFGLGSRAPMSGSQPQCSVNPNRARYPQTERTKSTAPLVWLTCAFLIGVGLVIFVVYLVYRPRNLMFDISNANLNAVSLDMGNLLSVDLTLLANFTNPNARGSVEFKHSTVGLYHYGTPVASANILSFPLTHGEYKFQNVHLAGAQVGISSNQSSLISKQMEGGSVWFRVQGTFRTSFVCVFKYSYLLHGYCTIVLTYPPPGVLIAKSCTTKRV